MTCFISYILLRNWNQLVFFHDYVQDYSANSSNISSREFAWVLCPRSDKSKSWESSRYKDIGYLGNTLWYIHL